MNTSLVPKSAEDQNLHFQIRLCITVMVEEIYLELCIPRLLGIPRYTVGSLVPKESVIEPFCCSCLCAIGFNCPYSHFVYML